MALRAAILAACFSDSDDDDDDDDDDIDDEPIAAVEAPRDASAVAAHVLVLVEDFEGQARGWPRWRPRALRPPRGLREELVEGRQRLVRIHAHDHRGFRQPRVVPLLVLEHRSRVEPVGAREDKCQCASSTSGRWRKRRCRNCLTVMLLRYLRGCGDSPLITSTITTLLAPMPFFLFWVIFCRCCSCCWPCGFFCSTRAMESFTEDPLVFRFLPFVVSCSAGGAGAAAADFSTNPT